MSEEKKWAEYQELVLSQLEGLNKKYDTLNEKMNGLCVKLAVQEEKQANTAGKISLFVSSVMAIAVSLIMKLMGGG